MEHDETFTSTVRAVLDPLLRPYGFASGQGSDALEPEQAGGDVAWVSSDPSWRPPAPAPPSGRLVASLTFCADYDDLGPGAQALVEQVGAGGMGCVDIIVQGSSLLGITRVEYEARPLEDLLDAVDLAGEALRVRALPSGDLDADVATTAEALQGLLRRVG